MDVAGFSAVIDIHSIATWQNSTKLTKNYERKPDKSIIFECSPDINNKIVLWCGDIYQLKSEAIVIPINNLIDGRLSIESSSIYQKAGNKYARSFVNKVLGCKTSEVRVTEGYDLPCYYVFHTVCPRYNPKYESAAINAIYNCYRNSLSAAMDRKIRKIGFAVLHISKYPFPDDVAIHIAARTIRRFLEKYTDSIDVIVLQITEDLLSIYNEIMPIYFPRNSNEENYSVLQVPSDLGNADGQPIQPDREIRISAFPYGPRERSSDSEGSIDEDENKNRHFSDISSTSVRSLSQSNIPPAIRRQSASLKVVGGMSETLKNYEENLAMERKFNRLFQSSKILDLSSLRDLKVFYQCGKDIHSKPILLVVERNIPRDIDYRKPEVFSFIISVLEKSTKSSNFSIIYAHTRSQYQPSRVFLTELYNLLKSRYMKCLNCICMVHPTLYNRGVNWIFTTFNAPDLKSKLFNVTNLRQLYRIVNPMVLDLPDFIHQYDKEVGGTNAYNVSHDEKDSSTQSDNFTPPLSSTCHEEL